MVSRQGVPIHRVYTVHSYPALLIDNIIIIILTANACTVARYIKARSTISDLKVKPLT